MIGCSFMSRLQARYNGDMGINAAKYHVLASPGTGNQAIAARAMHQLSQQHYDHVVVLWSGINRVDFPVSEELQRTQHNNPDGDWVASCNIGNMAWYHSGGFLGTGVFGAVPDPVQIFMRAQYLGSEPNSQYLSELTLMSIVNLQSLLVARGISYKMAFIYNTEHGDIGCREEHAHGKLDRTSSLNNLVDWSKFNMNSNPYEWAKHQDRLESDQYHPTRNAMIEWFKEHMSIDMTQ
jgi:hypothetical protein